MKHLLPILCLFGFMFSDTIYLKDTFGDNKTIYNVDYLGYKGDTIYFQKGGREIAFNYDDINKIVDDNNNRINPYKEAFDGKESLNKQRKKSPNYNQKSNRISRRDLEGIVYDNSESIQNARNVLITASVFNLLLVNGISKGSIEESGIDIMTLVTMGLYIGGIVELTNAIDN